MKITIKELTNLSILGSLMFLGQYIFQFIPNIEVVSLFIIIFSLIYGKKIFYSIMLFELLMCFSYGFGIWILGYIVIWPMLAIITIVLKKYLIGNYFRLSLFSGSFGFLFGGCYAIFYIFVGGFSLAFTYWISGIIFDIIHMLGNYFIMLFVGKSLYNIMVKINMIYLRDNV